MSTKLKICGITRMEDAVQLAELGVDFLGFNFYPESPRYISPAAARDLILAVRHRCQTVGILVRPTRKTVQEVLEKSGVTLLQIYEPIDFQDYSDIPVPVIDCARISDPAIIPDPRRGAAYLLLDRFHPRQMGGTGQAFDWQRLPDHLPRSRLILAGGIHPGNIRQALEQVAPAVIDVASGAEHSPGVKDISRVLQLLEALAHFNARQYRRMHSALPGNPSKAGNFPVAGKATQSKKSILKSGRNP